MGSEVLAGRYALGGVLATGGMAMVHLGTRVDDKDHAPVAIKRLHQHLLDQTEFVAMFLDEARLTKRLRHPSIVQTLDVVFGEHELFLVMEYLEGETLAAVRKSARAKGVDIPIPLAARIVHDALEGLGSAHEAQDGRGKLLGVVHRDFSPANLMVCTDGRSRVLDFGVAKAEGRLASTQGGALKGKISYMAPEQLLGTEVDCRSDLFAVGIMLWELLTVRRAYAGGDNDAAIIARVIAPDFPLPSTLRSGINPALDEISRRALAPKREDRFASANEMAAALAAATPLASREEVGAFVVSVSAAVLAERRANVLALPAIAAGTAVPPPPVAPSPDERSGSGTFPGLAPASSAPTPVPDAPHEDDELLSAALPKRSRWPWLVGVAGIAVLLVGWGLSSGDRGAEANGAGPASATPPPSALVAAAPSASAVPSAREAEGALVPVVPSAEPAASVASASASATLPAVPGGQRPPPGTAAGPGKKGTCASSPYTKGPGGILRVRPECL